MRAALLHYWLVNMRGGEAVLAEFCRIFPGAPIYTHACERSVIAPEIAEHPVHESFIGNLPGARRNCQRYLPLMPAALKRLDLSEFELLVSSESGPVKGVRKGAGATHICYCHTPMRYIWDMYEEYYRSQGVFGRLAMKLFAGYMRRCDLVSAEGVDFFVANSAFVAERIRRIYRRESTVIHPPVDHEYFASAGEGGARDYYLFVGQLLPYKRPDLAVAACRRLGRRLVVAGDGGMRRELEKAAGGDPGIVFEGRVGRERLRELYGGAKALLFPGMEDFGIVPLEAMAAGTPVIALGKGGALETVEAGRSGVFFDEPEVGALVGAMEEFGGWGGDAGVLRRRAADFGRARFRSEFSAFVQKNKK